MTTKKKITDHNQFTLWYVHMTVVSIGKNLSGAGLRCVRRDAEWVCAARGRNQTELKTKTQEKCTEQTHWWGLRHHLFSLASVDTAVHKAVGVVSVRRCYSSRVPFCNALIMCFIIEKRFLQLALRLKSAGMHRLCNILFFLHLK